MNEKTGLVGSGLRKRVTLFGEHFYLTVTDGEEIIVDCTVPFENRPDRLQERQVVETICHEATELLELLSKKRRGL